MKTRVYLWYIAQLFLEWEMVQIKVAEKIYILCSQNFLFRKSCRLWDNMEKNIVEPDRHHMTIWYDAEKMRFSYRMAKAREQTRARTHSHTHTQSHNIHYFLLFHSNSGYANRPHCYIIRTYPVLCDTPAALILQSLRARCTAYFKLGQ